MAYLSLRRLHDRVSGDNQRTATVCCLSVCLTHIILMLMRLLLISSARRGQRVFRFFCPKADT